MFSFDRFQFKIICFGAKPHSQYRAYNTIVSIHITHTRCIHRILIYLTVIWLDYYSQLHWIAKRWWCFVFVFIIVSYFVGVHAHAHKIYMKNKKKRSRYELCMNNNYNNTTIFTFIVSMMTIMFQTNHQIFIGKEITMRLKFSQIHTTTKPK